MSVFLHSYPVDLSKPKTARQSQALLVTQDNMADRIQAEVTDGGLPHEITGAVTGKVMLGDGQTVTIIGDSEGNMAYIDLPQLAYSVPGVITITLKETVGSVETSLLQVIATVRKSTTGIEIDPGETMATYEALIEAIDEAMSDLPTPPAVSGTTLVLS